MEDRRKLERFELRAPARVSIEDGNRKAEYELTTRDVSSDGAYLYSTERVPEGASIKMEFMLSLDTLHKIADQGGRAKVRVRGKVIRSDPDGIAIRFSRTFKITAFGSGGLRNGE